MLRKLFTNSLAEIALQVLNIVVVFVMTPIIVRSLGNYDYGIWEIVMSVIGYMGLLQFGIPPAIVRYVARYNALNEKDRLDEIYSSCFIIILLTGLLCAFLIFLWTMFFSDTLAGNQGGEQKYTIFLLILSVNVLIMFPNIFVQSFHEGFQRYRLTRFITAFKIIFSNMVAYILLSKGYGLLTFALIHTVSLFLKFLVSWMLLMTPAFGRFRLKAGHIKKDALRELYTFGAKSFALGVAGRINFQTDSIVIGVFLNPAIVTFYIIPVNLLNKLKTLGMSMTLVFMPHFSELFAKESDMERFKSEFLFYSRYIVGVFLGLFMGVFFLGLPFISIWIGPEFAEKGKFVFYIIGFSFLLPFLNPLHGRTLTGMGMHGALAKLRVFEALMNLSLSIVLVNVYGKEGVALGTLLPALVVEPLILQVVSKRIGVSSLVYLKSVLLPQVLPVFGVAAIYFYLTKFIMASSYWNIIQIGISSSLIYFICFWGLVMSRDERHLIIKKLGIISP